jgi:hypothetical protein
MFLIQKLSPPFAMNKYYFVVLLNAYSDKKADVDMLIPQKS